MTRPVRILSIKIKNESAKITDNFILEIFYEIKEVVEKNFDLKIIYVVSSNDENIDQELEYFQIPSGKLGKFKMILNVRPPNYNKICVEDIIGMGAIVIAVFYQEKQLISIGYYVHNQYCNLDSTEAGEEHKSTKYSILRNILVKEPRVTYFSHVFHDQ